MLIDTHCHLDYLDVPEIAQGIPGVMARARRAGVAAIVVPTVSPDNVARVMALADSQPEVYVAIGIHPMYVQDLSDNAITEIKNALDRYRHHPKLVAVGEIGLDHYVPGLDHRRMETFFHAQCKFAREVDLPVILHVRKAQDRVLAGLRRFGIARGIAHAFNGSHAQAKAYIDHGLALGMGGAMTFTRALQIRRLATEFPLSSLVLETDSPDISPSWKAKGELNEPAETLRIAQCLAALRATTFDDIVQTTAQTAHRVLPRLGEARPPRPTDARA